MGQKVETRGQRNIKWIEKYCRVPEGADTGKPIRLRKFQRVEILKIYDNPHGTRRGILSFGRKNGKTALAACLMLLHLVGPEAKPNGQLFSAAQSRAQAAILFRLAMLMVRMSPELNDFVDCRESSKQLFCRELGTIYTALSAEAATAYGLSPSFLVHDELGQVRGPRSPLYEALETATGGQKEPLSIIISTQAPTDADLLSVLIDDALKGIDKKVVVSLYTADEDINPFTKKAIRQANPAFGDFQNPDETLSMAKDAKRMPSREAEYRNLILNQRVEANSPFITKSAWQACAGKVREDWGDRPVYGGLDLSSTTDLTGLVLTCPIDDVYHVKPTFWLPEQGLRERSRADRVPYDVWHDQGHLKTTPGTTVEYEWVAYRLFEVFQQYNIEAMCFDKWGFKYLKPWLLSAGFTEEQIEEKFVEFGQGYATMSPAMRDVESLILQQKLRHGNHPVLTMCMANAVVKSDPAGNRMLDKSKSTGRIDGAVCLVMAGGAGVMQETPETKSTPQFGLYFMGGGTGNAV